MINNLMVILPIKIRNQKIVLKNKMMY